MPRGENGYDADAAQNTVFDALDITAEDLGPQGTEQGDVDSNDGNLIEDKNNNRQQQKPLDDLSIDDRDVSHNQQRQPQDRQRDNQARQRPDQQQQQRPLAARAEVRPDAKGNLVDSRGRVVANAGREARYYQENHRYKEALQARDTQVRDTTDRLRRAVEIAQELDTELTTAKAHQNAVKQFGLEPAEQLEAMQFAAKFKANPLDTIKAILTRAAANGVDLKELGVQNSGGVDSKALMQLVREEIGKVTQPITEQNKQRQAEEKQQQDQQRLLQQTESRVVNFFSANPDAKQYMPIFMKLYQDDRFKDMSLGEAWAKIQLNLERYNRSNPNQRQNAQRRSPPVGRGAPGGQEGQSSDMAPISQSYDTIIRDALKLVA